MLVTFLLSRAAAEQPTVVADLDRETLRQRPFANQRGNTQRRASLPQKGGTL